MTKEELLSEYQFVKGQIRDQKVVVDKQKIGSLEYAKHYKVLTRLATERMKVLSSLKSAR